MESLPDFNALLLAVAVLYFWYAPLLLILSRADLNLRQRLCWGCVCLCSSWFSYFWLKQYYKSHKAKSLTNY